MDAERRRRFAAYFSGPPLRGDRQKLMKVTGLSKGRVSQLFDEAQPFGERAAVALAEKLGLPSDAFLSGRASAQETAPSYAGPVPTQPMVAQDVSQMEMQHAPLITWGALMQPKKLPALFWIELPDDSMAPRAPAGRLICFDTTMQPRPGDGVLVADATGTVHFRLYRAGAGDRWSAHALNEAYGPLDSQRDGLQVLAVLKAEEGRWS